MPSLNYLPPSFGLHDVGFWVDGLGESDRKTKTAYTFSGVTAGIDQHKGRWITLDGTGYVACGDTGEPIKAFCVWINGITQYSDTLLDLDGTYKIIRTGADVSTNIPNATIWVDNEEAIETAELVSNFVCVSWPVAIDASNLTLGDGLLGSFTQAIGFTKEITFADMSWMYYSGHDPKDQPHSVGEFILEIQSGGVNDYILQEDEYYIQIESGTT